MAPLTLTWTKIHSAPILQRSSQILAVHSNNAYIFGGELLPRSPRDNAVHIVSFATPSPTPTPLQTSTNSALPTPRVGTASTLLSSTLYLFSGRGGLAMAPLTDGPGALYALPLSSPSPSWSLVTPASASAPVPEARSYHALTSDGAGRIFLHAGCPESGRLNDFWVFDVRDREWSRLADAPGGARGGASLGFSQGKVYRMNGFDGEKEVGGAVDVYHVEEGRWETVEFEADGKEGPGRRSVGALLAMRVDGRDVLVTLFGEGEASSLGHAGAGKFWGDVWAFDVERRKWTEVQQKGEKPERRGWFAADVVGNDTGAVQGGLGEGNERLDDLWTFKLEAA
ncbi:galactose oxidase-like protein 5 [Elsinoe australis]|uniref:Galactose oxidase-like protein 5 n=1 Tax=Elsinoe australis TaxID=40998 RepID=A0A4U7B144_9PEZI|nr:galactose oxidase-like protein 5 [Elsinoe australis]